MIKFNVLTLFPESFQGPLDISVIGRAKGKHWDLNLVNIRDFANDNYKTVDDTPAGGGAGMILKPEVLSKAIDSVHKTKGGKEILYMSPRGERFNQDLAQQYVKQDEITILCGRYEGVDQRIIDYYGIKEISLGDFVMAGGEVAAMAIIESTVRLKKGVLKGQDSLVTESFNNNLLEHDQYTGPRIWQSMAIPDIIVSGNHKLVEGWRYKNSVKKTKERRIDLYKQHIKEKK